jgi:hypothetical protein
MEEGIQQRWKGEFNKEEGFNNDGWRYSTEMEENSSKNDRRRDSTKVEGRIQQRWAEVFNEEEEFNKDGRRDSTTMEGGIQLRCKEGFNYDGSRDSTMMEGEIQQRWEKRRFAQRNRGEDG